MKIRTSAFVGVLVVAAGLVTFCLPSVAPPTARDELTAIAVLATFALVAELLSILLPKDASASMAAFPLLALITISPTWQAIAAVVFVKALVESTRQRELTKGIFNIAQYALSNGIGSLIFVSLGGASVLGLGNEPIGSLTRLIGVQAFIAFFTAMTVNSLMVSAVVALSSGAGLASVWRANTVIMIGVEILFAPLIFVFAWVYARFGAIVAATAWAPIIGIHQAHKTNLELARTNEELLELMVKSMEARDAYTSGHSRRVQHYSILIARTLGLSERDTTKVGRAALLHDVGKIHEKYGTILRKADRLSPEEWATMREHPVDGANLVATMTKLRDLVAAVRHHHENWDGSGYPDGLAGELIPLAARIIRFADTIDAMTTARPYRPGMAAEEVRSEIVRCRGTQFDPHIVDQLLSSPGWKAMFPPAESVPPRFGTLAVLPSRHAARGARI